MHRTIKMFSPALFLLALMCFALPWMHVSCQGQRIATLTGIQMVTGTTIQQQGMGMFGQRKAQKIPPEPFAIIVCIITVIGLVMGFIRGRTSSMFSGAAGAIACILLLILKTKIETDAFRESQGLLHVDYAIGFWFFAILCMAAVALSVFTYMGSKEHLR